MKCENGIPVSAVIGSNGRFQRFNFQGEVIDEQRTDGSTA